MLQKEKEVVLKPQDHPSVIEAQQVLTQARSRLAQVTAEYERLFHAQDSSDRILASEAVLKLPEASQTVRQADIDVKRAEQRHTGAFEGARAACRLAWEKRLQPVVEALVEELRGPVSEKYQAVKDLTAEAGRAGCSFSTLEVQVLEAAALDFVASMLCREVGLPPSQ